jgi:hypothetical protein
MNKLDYNNWVTKGLAFAFCIALAAFLITLHHDGKLRDDVRSLKVQLAHSYMPMKVDTIRDSVPVYETVVKEIDRTDYKKQVADRQLIKDLKIKLADVTEENRLLTRQLRQIQLQPREEGDSLLEFHDQWADLIYDTTTNNLDFTVRDSLVTFVTRVPRHKFLWFRWGTKGYQVRIASFNPYTQLKYEGFILK